MFSRYFGMHYIKKYIIAKYMVVFLLRKFEPKDELKYNSFSKKNILIYIFTLLKHTHIPNTFLNLAGT